MLDALAILKDARSTALTASGNGTGVALSKATGNLRINTTEIDLSSGNETYKLTLQESDDDSTYTEIFSVNIDAVGEINRPYLQKKKYLRLAWVLAGTTPSIKLLASVGVGA